MTESEARAKPISEVWAHFQHIYETSKSGQWKTAFGLKTAAYISMLRAVLLERCKRQPQVILEDGESEVDFHLKHSAYHAFWAWELKQRNAESNG